MECVTLGFWPFVTRAWRWEKWLFSLGSSLLGSSGFQLDPVMVKAESLGDSVIWVEAKTLGKPLLTEGKWGKPVGRWETNPTGDGFAAMDKIGFNRVDISLGE